jgi:hypothetical protein
MARKCNKFCTHKLYVLCSKKNEITVKINTLQDSTISKLSTDTYSTILLFFYPQNHNYGISHTTWYYYYYFLNFHLLDKKFNLHHSHFNINSGGK